MVEPLTMLIAKIPLNEPGRLRALHGHRILDTHPETIYDDLTHLAARICDTPISLISLIDSKRQWLKSRFGLNIQETPRDISFCSHTILRDDIFEVSDAKKDPHFCDNPLVTGEPRIAFYAGIPLQTSEGYNLGSLCVIDQKPRKLSDHQIESLKILARQIVHLLESHSKIRDVHAANLAKSSFLANMSHEIRTPLGAIMGFADELSQPGITEDQFKTYISVINRNSSHLQRIVDDILDLSKVEAGKMMFENVECSLQDLISEFAEFMTHAATENRVQFACQLQAGLPTHIISDPVRMRQILTNIVGNAIKFSAGGQVRLEVSSGGEHLEFRVKDTGIGISPEQADQLFQPFVQADQSTTRKFGGTGLGLALTKKLCESMGGSFYLEKSEPLLGSTFVARVRLQKPPLTRDYGPSARPELSGALPLDQSKILLVEDSLDNQLLLQILLGKAGATVSTANDGHEAVLKAMADDYDLILMDVQMPELDGIDATRELRRQGYKKPIIALTAHAMNEEKERCLKSGFDDFLTKPIQKTRMLSVLKANIQNGRHDKGTLGVEIH